jgi:hypothetical protein
MLLPAVLAGIEKRHHLSCLRISRFEPVAFEQIATAATQRQIGIVIGASVAGWDNVFNFERKIENCFRSLTVLASMSRSASNARIMGIHRPKSASSAAALSPEARTSASTKPSNSA